MQAIHFRQEWEKDARSGPIVTALQLHGAKAFLPPFHAATLWLLHPAWDGVLMRSAILLVCLSCAAGACARLPQEAGASDTTGGGEARRLASYPYSEIGVVYETVLDAMTDTYFSKHPDLDREHTARLKSFIRSESPTEEFVRTMTGGRHAATFDQAMKDPAYRETQDFKDEFSVVTSIAVTMAQMVVGGHRDTYVARYVEKDPVKSALLTTVTGDDRQCVSWLQAEVTRENFLEAVGAGRDVLEGDTFYFFSSPDWNWEHLCGRSGYIHVRDKKVVDVIVTHEN